jgi:hypothetical protein
LVLSRPETLCIFGDSHIGSVRRALDAGLEGLDGFEVEFWGAAGPLFRQIDIRQGVVRPIGKEAEEVVLRVNGKGRATLAPGDFDTYLFYGARLRIAEFMLPYLHHLRDPRQAVSSAVMQAAARQFLASCRAVRIARSFAASGSTRVFFAPAPLMTDGMTGQGALKSPLKDYPRATEATAADRTRVWQMFAQLLADDGITLIAQPDETVVNGVFTSADFAIEGAEASGDAGHKSPEFAALMLRAFVAAARRDGCKKTND